MGGVDQEPLHPKTYFLFPGFTTIVYKYDVSSQVFVMNDVPSSVDMVGHGREKDAYLVQSKEGQDMHISMNVRWRLDTTKIIELHTKTRGFFEEKLLRPVLLRVVKDKATMYSAFEAYSGEGLVRLQAEIEKSITDENGELRHRGIIVENFVIEGIGLDPQYIGEIKSRQVATQRELRAKAEEKAALAEAQRAKAEAQANYEKTVVEAERDKQVGILNAEKEAQQQILAAEAEKTSSVLKAQAVKAMGEAEAEAKKLQLSAYAVPGAESFVQIEVSKSMADAFKNISGYLPSDMKINLLSESFLKAVQNISGK
jgi:regulator of protease activity HflC (stomatin/prohibitin superfamily)